MKDWGTTHQTLGEGFRTACEAESLFNKDIRSANMIHDGAEIKNVLINTIGHLTFALTCTPRANGSNRSSRTQPT